MLLVAALVPRYHWRHRHHWSHPLSHGLAYVYRLPGVEYRVILLLALVTTGVIGIIGATHCRTDSLTLTAFLVSNTE